MKFLSQIGDWFLKQDSSVKVAIFGIIITVLMAVTSGIWDIYKYFSDKTKEKIQTNITNQNSTVINVQGNNNTVGDPNAAANIMEIVNTLTEKHQHEISKYENQAQAKEQQIKALTEAVTYLSRSKDIPDSKQERSLALNALTQGDTLLAKKFFIKNAENGEAGARETATTYRHLGALSFFDNTQEALKYYYRATELDPSNADSWNQLGMLLTRTGELNEAIVTFQKVLSLSETNQEKQEQAWAYGNLGLVYKIKGNDDKAIEYIEKALEIDEKLGNKINIAIGYNNLGALSHKTNKPDKAIEYLKKALMLNKNLSNKKGMAENYGNLGIVNYTQPNLDKAIDYLQQATSIHESLQDKLGLALDYSLQAAIYNDLSDSAKAVDYLEKSLAINQDLQNKEGMASNYTNLGYSYFLLGNIQESKKMYNKSLNLYKNLNNPKEVLSIQSFLDALNKSN